MAELVELLFFDTFAHENSEELNLDLVQFPKPVYVTEVRIIPLGARVQADFPGGVRLGATNPSQFQIEFFVNDLGKPGASTFETLGGFEYNQNGCINLKCTPDDNIRKIPTDGLVLRGWYTTITLAVYGTLTANITEQIIPPVVTPSLPAQTSVIAEVQQINLQNTIENEWQEPIQPVAIEYSQPPATQYPAPYVPPENYQQDYGEYYNEVPKDPRGYHPATETEWENKNRGRSSERDRDRSRDANYQKPELDHDHNERRERDRRYSRSQSKDRTSRDYHDGRDKEHDRELTQEYRDHDKDWDRDRDRDREGRDRYKHSEYRRYSDRDERKRPRTPPPVPSPKRPHTPHSDHKDPSPKEVDQLSEDESEKQKERKDEKVTVQEESAIDVEEFEPILSDEDILDDSENFQEVDYDYSNYLNNDDLIKLFVPGTNQVRKYKPEPDYKIIDSTLIMNDRLKNIVANAEDFFKSSITKYDIREFHNLNTEIKEEFIHLCEKVPSMFETTFSVISRIYKEEDVKNRESTQQIFYIVESLLNWIKIALDYEMANAQDQPAYKIRHIKCGVKLAEWSSQSVPFLKLLWQQDFYIHEALINLYEQEYMALSIKLMIVKALDTYLSNKPAIEIFLLGPRDVKIENGYHNLTLSTAHNGYKTLVELIEKNPSVRVKFSLNSILKKLNIYETLHKLQLTAVKVCNNEKYVFNGEELNLISSTLEYLLHFCDVGPFVLSQPKRFLPVAAQFEIGRQETKNILVDLFQMQNLLEIFVVLLTNQNTMVLTNIKKPIYEILVHLTKTVEGLRYLSDNTETANVLLKILFRDDETFSLDFCEFKTHNLGLSIAYKLECLYHIECLKELGEKCNYECDTSEVIDELHAIFSLTFPNIGKLSVAKLLGMEDNVKFLLRFIDLSIKPDVNLDKYKKSPAAAYIIDLLAYTIIYNPNIPLLEMHFRQILELVNQSDLFESSTSVKLTEISAYLKPYENFKENYDVSVLIDTINKNIGSVTSFSGTIITCLRILQHIGISEFTNKSEVFIDNPLNNFIELKYKHIILQLFPLDAVSLFGKILQELCDFYEQPALHTSTFVSSQGILIINIIYPCVLLLSQILTYVIQCRNTHFKDLTTVPILLHTYNLCMSFPSNSLGYQKARKICKLIVHTLLVYTQPVSEQIHEKDSLNKTLWTLMCGEIIKFIVSAPYKFVAGLSVFSELLPLPLPMQTLKELNKNEISWAINMRKLWSAHLHSHSSSIQELIAKLCTTTHPQLLNLLRKICAQISDLAANSAIMIGRGILDNVHSAIVINDDTKKLVCNGYIARLMNFLACLVTHNSLKCTFLHLLGNSSGGKGDEKYPAIIQAFAQILRSTSNVNSHVQTQECILSIIQSFCDTELTLYEQNSTKISPEVYLANAVPTKEHLIGFLNAMLEHVIAENSYITYLPVIRTMLLLTEHNYGFYYLKEALLRKSGSFYMLLAKLNQNLSKENNDCLTTLNTVIEFLKVCTVLEIEEPGSAFQARNTKMTIPDIQILVGWKKNNLDHPFKQLEEKLKVITKEDTSFEDLLENLQSMIKLLNGDLIPESKEACVEPTLPIPESLLVQFAGRPIFSTSGAADEQLTTTYWIQNYTSGEQSEADLENVTCDLMEICRQDLSPDINLVKQVEKLSRVCASETTEQVEKEKRMIKQMDKMKRPFITPVRGRGFARAPQVRSDLFRSRPPNTSRPPSLHVDDFVALETCGAQPTGPTGYNKISRELLATSRVTRGTRGGRSFIATDRSLQYRQMSWWAPGRGPY